MARALNYAYALTVHKSQGSQYRKVIMLMLARDKFQLERSLIYTGVTRTREECVLVGDYNALASGINHVRTKTTVLQLIAKGGAA
jgi:exodeoxyribonuclease V alpha subunit